MVAVRIRDRNPPDNSAQEAEAIQKRIKGLLAYLHIEDPKEMLARMRKSGHNVNVTQEQLRFKEPMAAKGKGPKALARNKSKGGKLVKEESKSRFNTTSDDLEDKLKAVFGEYCSFGDPLNTVSMSSGKFMKLAKDSRLAREVGYAELDILFKKAARGIDDDGNKLSFWEFVDLLGFVGKKLRPDLDPQDAFYLVEDTVAQMAGHHLNRVVMGGPGGDLSREELAKKAEIERLVLHPAIWAVISECQRPLNQIFEFYSATQVAGFGRSDKKETQVSEAIAQSYCRKNS